MMRSTLRPAILPASFVASRWALLKYAGTVTTASFTGSPRYASASCFSFWRIIALISGGTYSLPSACTRTSPFEPWTTSYGTIVISSVTSEYLRPMKRLIEKMVFCGFVTCWRRAGAPTSRWPSFVNATTDGGVRPPSAFGREYEPEIVDAMVDKIEKRLEERLRERRQPAPRHNHYDLRLALGSMGIGIGVTAVATSNASGGGGVAIAIIAWLAIALINVVYALRR